MILVMTVVGMVGEAAILNDLSGGGDCDRHVHGR